MLEGLLVDLVPEGDVFAALEVDWFNNESQFFASGGEWMIMTRAQRERQRSAGGWRRREGRQHGVGFGIRTKDGTPIGTIRIHTIFPQHGLGMIGARIGDPAYWGGGYGTDALLLIADYGFDWLDLRRLWIKTTTMNVRVMRQMEKVGFRLEARQREGSIANGERLDWLTYGLLREEWPGRAALVERLGLRPRAKGSA